MVGRLFINNPLTSDAVRYARNAAILEEDPTLGLALADGGLGRHCLCRDAQLPWRHYP